MRAQKLEGYIHNTIDEPIDYADIFNLRTHQHTHSDDRGYFLLSDVVEGDSIKIGHFLYESKTINASKTSIIQIKLTQKSFDLAQVTILPSYDATKTLSTIDMTVNPLSNAQEQLRRVPGLFIGQHAGGGKAEQIFLRGFDIDHGTDINITFDGMPVNMISHAHGQGYADMHFIIPDILNQVSYNKGPYDVTKGNLATAGHIEFKSMDRPKESQISYQLGSFGTWKLGTTAKIIDNPKHSAYVSTDYLESDGPFEASQNLQRRNIMAKYTFWPNESDRLSLSVTHFGSNWDASGQVPERAIASGAINRFGAIDSTEGGLTHRSNIIFNYSRKLSPLHHLKTNAYFSNYDFLLFSNFTFFLRDSIDGDQIRQSELRNLYGFSSMLYGQFHHDSPWSYRAGVGIRYDDINEISLADTKNRTTVQSYHTKGQINESNLSTWSDIRYERAKWSIQGGVRLDYFSFKYDNQFNAPSVSQNAFASILSPKMTITYNLNAKTHFYTKIGRGFHSNDTRVVIDNSAKHVLPSALGIDFGATHKLSNNLLVDWALWQLDMQQEFVYVGDEGIVEPSGRSLRRGVELSARYQPSKQFVISYDGTYANPRAVEESEGEQFIPLAPIFTHSASILAYPISGLSIALHGRRLGDRPANENNTIIAKGYTILDANASYTYKRYTLSIECRNLLNTQWNETQFATTSRLANESSPIEEIHFTPGAPRGVNVKLGVGF